MISKKGIATGGLLAAIIALAVGGLIFFDLASDVYDEASDYRSDTATVHENVSQNFAANDTCYEVASEDITEIVAVYNDSSHAATLPTSQYSLCSDETEIKLTQNASYPVGVKYVDYNDETTGGNMGLLFGGTVFIILGAVAIFNKAGML